MSYDTYTGLLKAFPMPDTVKSDVHFMFDNDNLNFTQLKSSYPIETIAGEGGDFSKAVNLMHWLSEHISYKGDFDREIAHNSLKFLNYSYDKGSLCGINCVAFATILSECLLSVGSKARRVFLMPCSPYDGDFHAVTHVYIREMSKWVMLDPTFALYFSNEQGEILSLLELRNCLANQTSVFTNKEAKYNNMEYFAKNLFCFQMFEKSTFCEGNAIGEGQVSENRTVILSPKGFDAKNARLNNIEYRIKIFKCGDDPRIRSWMERVKREEYVYCSIVDFEELPKVELLSN